MRAILLAIVTGGLLLTGCSDTFFGPPYISASYRFSDLGGGAEIVTAGNSLGLPAGQLRNWVAEAMPGGLGRRVVFSPANGSNDAFRRVVWHFSSRDDTRSDQLCGGLPDSAPLTVGQPLYVSVGFCLGHGTLSGARGRVPWTGSLETSALRSLIVQMTLYIFPSVNPLDRDRRDPLWQRLRSRAAMQAESYADFALQPNL